MPRSLRVPRVGVGGRRTDVPSWALDPAELADGSRDGIVYEGALRSRTGFKTYASDASVTTRYEGVWRAAFPISRRTATITTYQTRSGSILYQGISDNGTVIDNWSTASQFAQSPLIPRAMYRGELLACYQNGVSSLRRLGGANPASSLTHVGAITTTAAQSVVTAATSIGGAPGAFFPYVVGAGTGTGPIMFASIASATATTATLNDFRATVGQALSTSRNYFVGLTYPAISVYESGTVSTNGGTFTATGVGTKWMSDPATYAMDISAGLYMASANRHFSIDGIPLTDTTWFGYSGPNLTSQSYAITSRCPFKDVCVHQETLYGGGAEPFLNRVYVGPPNWNLAYPPGSTLPFTSDTEFIGTSRSDYLIDYVDVPSHNDADQFVAILATDGPRIVLKQNSVYGIYGNPPSLDVKLLHSGDGCIDIRSAISVAGGAFWAGRDGIYRWRNGVITELTAGWMRNEWRALVNAGIDYCALGVDGRKLIASIKTADASQTKRTYMFDLELGRWLPELSNLYPRHMFTTSVSGELQSFLCVDDAYTGKIINLRPALDGSGPARDELGTGPNFKVVTGDSLIGGGDTETESRVLNVDIHANVQDQAGTTTLTVTSTHGGALRGDGGPIYDTATYDSGATWGPDGSKALGTIPSSTDDTLNRNQFLVNRMGRRMGLTIEQTTTSPTAGVVELGELVVEMRDARKGT